MICQLLETVWGPKPTNRDKNMSQTFFTPAGHKHVAIHPSYQATWRQTGLDKNQNLSFPFGQPASQFGTRLKLFWTSAKFSQQSNEPWTLILTMLPVGQVIDDIFLPDRKIYRPHTIGHGFCWALAKKGTHCTSDPATAKYVPLWSKLRAFT